MMKRTHKQEREDLKARLTAAIKTKRVIEFYYHGGYRTVEPFCLGATATGGAADNDSLLCYQVGGHAEYGGTTGWKLYRVSEMTDVAMTKEQFTGDRPGYEPANPEMAVIYCRIDLDGKAPAPERKTAPKIAGTVPVQKVAAVPLFLTHNEKMRRFRDTHPLPEAELGTRLTV